MYRLFVPLLVAMGQRGVCECALQNENATAQIATGEQLRVEITPTFGLGGGVRPTRFLPGETLHVRSTAGPLARQADGRIRCSYALELLDRGGANVFAGLSRDDLYYEPIFGGCMQTRSPVWKIPLGFPAGKYRLRVRVDDRVTARSGKTDLPVEIMPPETFGVFEVRFALDEKGEHPCGAVVAPGTNLYMLFSPRGLAVRGGRVKFELALTALDGASKPVAKARCAAFNLSFESGGTLQVPLPLHANRPGRFLLHLEIRDLVADKRAIGDVPLLVALPDVCADCAQQTNNTSVPSARMRNCVSKSNRLSAPAAECAPANSSRANRFTLI